MRPPARKCTVRVVGKKGEVRLSPDLCFSKRFQIGSVGYATGGVGGVITLEPVRSGGLRVYYTNERALSGRISLGPILRNLSFVLEKLAGRTFEASKQGGKLLICFDASVADVEIWRSTLHR